MLEQLIKTLPATQEDRDFAPVFFVFAVFMASGGLVWGCLCVYFGVYLPALIPFGYLLVTAANLWFWVRHEHHFDRVRTLQVFFSILLPFFFQWLLGGFHATGCVMIWSLLALIGSLTFYQIDKVWGWGGLFVVLTVVSIGFERQFQAMMPEGLRDGSGSQILMGLNFGMVSLMLFVLGGYVVKVYRETVREVELKHQALERADQEQEIAYQTLLAQEEELRQNTEELLISNESLNQIQLQLEESLASEKLAKKALERAKNSEIAKQNAKIKQSIRAAKRIQQAMLPDMSEFKKAFPQSFIFFSPMDIVSGDVYWSYVKGDEHIVAVVDCTGHGVPGAILSMIAFEQLVEIVNLYQITDPGLILTSLHASVFNILKQEKGESREGMDISICNYNTATQTLSFAGAKRPLYYIKGGVPHVVAGDKMSIGGQTKAEVKFATHEIPIDEATTFYLYSDGYQDQFGGADSRKFMAKRLKKLLFDHHHLPLPEQSHLLDTTIQDWLQGNRQIDDILIVGCQIPF